MKIVLVRTSGVDEKLFNQTIEFFKGFSGFTVIGYPRVITMNVIHGQADFDDFFSRINVLRDVATDPLIEENDFVALLTEVPNKRGFFSFFQKSQFRRNAFVNINDWEFFTSSLQVHYSLAYQIVENCLQSLMNLDEKDGHLAPKGCVNDSCYQKSEVIIKMQTANICPDCIKRIRAFPDALAFQNYALSVMTAVRANLVVLPEENAPKEENVPKEINPEECRLIIDSANRRFRVIWNDNEIANYTMTALSFAFYITFLQNFASGGLSWADLSKPEHKAFMTDTIIKLRGRKNGVDSLIDNQNYFLQRVSIVNSSIMAGFGESIRISTEVQNRLKINSSGRLANRYSLYSVPFGRDKISFISN
jgi:hypothetical protein